jgi:periplasmic protein TonB
MTRKGFSPPGHIRLGVAAVVVLLHVALGLSLIRAFAPALTARMADRAFSAVMVSVPISPPEPPSSPAPEPTRRAAELSGTSAEAGRRAEASPIAAPLPRIVLPARVAPPVAGNGADNMAGASDTGAGTGAGGQGSGLGSGASGSGRGGGGAAAKAVKIAGDINSTRDYPAASREQRLGDYVIVALTVGTEGRVKNCRVHRASKDGLADQITCRLATERFRFRPATDGNGKAIESVYGWQQRWFAPRD